MRGRGATFQPDSAPKKQSGTNLFFHRTPVRPGTELTQLTEIINKDKSGTDLLFKINKSVLGLPCDNCSIKISKPRNTQNTRKRIFPVYAVPSGCSVYSVVRIPGQPLCRMPGSHNQGKIRDELIFHGAAYRP